MAYEGDGFDGEVVELLQQLIRNRCVNDGTDSSGHERRSVDTLASYLGSSGFDAEVYEPTEGRASLVARMAGTDPAAPRLLLMGHTDVVPVTEEGWDRDPFGGELVDGEVWGRGAVDMLNLTASMAVAFRRLAAAGFRPRGDLAYLAVADEEALGTHGAGWLTTNAGAAVAADYVITESGGIPINTAAGPRLPVVVGEKGAFWVRLTVRGTPGHASQPLRTDNALVKGAEVVRRIAEYRPAAMIHDAWRRFVEGIALPPEMAEPLLDPDRIMAFCESFPSLGLARQAHACTHTTFAPTVLHAGTKTNVIPDRVVLDVDIRTLPGQVSADVRAMLDEAVGDLGPWVDVEVLADDPSTASPVDTPLWDAITRVGRSFHVGGEPVPLLTVGATDARFFRRIGATAYGFGMFSSRMSFDQFNAMFHGDNERVDVESLAMSTAMWARLAEELLG
ncbi:MAG TPA: M20/M25/M40 family metallo-hydrolase [Acidimicrobiales bacterium]|nr:M20/M25/M40 family metallo-hydrolase [Acidimicrobiales bacterium]